MAINAQGGNPYQQVDFRNILNLPPDQLAEAISASGAMNVGPPVKHSAFLKNKFTGLVLPWDASLAEQRDLMVPCDKDGDTDPAAWEATVVDMDDDAVRDEQERLYWQARASVVEHAMDTQGMYDARVRRGAVMPENPEIPGVMTLEQYYDTSKDVPTPFGGKGSGKRRKKES